MGDKVVRDGRVAVLVSGGYGAGWYTWNSKKELLFDPILVAAVERNDRNAAVARAEEIEPGGCWIGIDGLRIEWIDEGSVFRLSEYDGAEGLVMQDNDDWIVA